VIHKLDIPRDQVYAEIVIMEMAVNRDFEYSSNVINPTNGLFLNTNTDLVDFITSPGAQKGAILSFAGGGSRTLSIGGTNVTVSGIQGLIKALQTSSNANILATPQIMTLDNTEATFETAEKIPFPTTTAVNGAVGTSISKENVSLTVTIKPQINKMSNFVKLDVQAKLADISGREPPKQVRDIAFATIERNAKTSVVVADNDTIVLGGLMRDNQSETTSKIPLLGDIPILGWLFKSTKSITSKTNLMIFITPHIVRQYEKIRALLDKKLQERDEFIESSAGGKDLNRGYRDQIIRSLPDMKEITNYKPQAIQTIDPNQPGGDGTSGASSSATEGATTPETAPLEATPETGTPAPAQGD
jgi:general secretion pathway protein D